MNQEDRLLTESESDGLDTLSIMQFQDTKTLKNLVMWLDSQCNHGNWKRRMCHFCWQELAKEADIHICYVCHEPIYSDEWVRSGTTETKYHHKNCQGYA